MIKSSRIRSSLLMEWRRLRTVRSTWLITMLCLAASGGLGLAVALDGRDAPSLELAASVVNPGQPAPTPILLGILGVLAWGHDYRYGTIRPLLAVQPSRGVFAAARLTVFTGFLAVVAVAAVGLGWLAGVLATGGELSGNLTQPPIPRMLLGSVLFGIGCGWLGLAMGALLRSLPAAVAVLFAIPAVVEPLGGMVLGKVHQGAEEWLPFHAIGQVVWSEPVPEGPSPVVGGLLFLAVTLVALTLAVVGFIHRDA
jgi:ABC-2 type transport system permease protein